MPVDPPYHKGNGPTVGRDSRIGGSGQLVDVLRHHSRHVESPSLRRGRASGWSASIPRLVGRPVRPVRLLPEAYRHPPPAADDAPAVDDIRWIPDDGAGDQAGAEASAGVRLEGMVPQVA